MKKTAMRLCFLVFAGVVWQASAADDARVRAGKICSGMSIEDKITLIRGQGFRTAAIPEHGIPQMNMANASQGVKYKLSEEEKGKLPAPTAFPPTILLAATWNPDIAAEYAAAIGEEARAGLVDILLGPGMNLYRVSQCGRNFEYVGEDPFLASRIIERYVKALQQEGVMATLKHFILNNTELDRRKSNSVIDERTVREIYLPAYKAGINAGAKAVMTSYNLVNGEWAGQSHYVITELLRKELGFEGLVMSDWRSVWDAEKIIKSGLDIEMPRGKNLKKTKDLLDDGRVDISEINRMVENILTACIEMGFLDRGERKIDTTDRSMEHEKVALETAREGIVLLKNSGGILPLKKAGGILVTGKYVENNARGKGSGCVDGYDKVSMRAALEKMFGKKAKFVESPSDADIKNADAVILSTGTDDGENGDRPFDLPTDENDRIKKICGLNPKTVVIVHSGSAISMSGWNDEAAAVIYAWYPGQIGQVALAEILAGKVNPSGKLPITIEKSFKDSPAYGYEPKDRSVSWTNRFKPSPQDDDRSMVYDVKYHEGIHAGYRWYEHKKIAPLYPFGHGLSYTKFEYSNLDIDTTMFGGEGEVAVTFDIRNSGDMDGMEIAQVYVCDPECSVERASKDLRGFKKVFIERGGTKGVEILLDREHFEFWHPEKRKWVFEPGEFRIMVGKSSADIVLEGSCDL